MIHYHKHSLINRLHIHVTWLSLLMLMGWSVISVAFVSVSESLQVQAASVLTTIGETPAAEDSGLVGSKQYPGVFWWHRDGGPATADKPRDAIYAVKFDTNGNLQNVRGSDKFPFFMVDGPTNNNWEDIALDDSNNIWIGDIGANLCGRNDQKLIKVKEPNPSGTETLTVLASYTFKFPDPASGCNTWNSEAMFWLDGNMYIFAKTTNSPVYRVNFPSGNSGTATLTRLGTLAGGVSSISVSSVSSDHGRLMVAGHERMNIYKTTNTNLRGDAFVRDIISRSPAFTTTFNCNCANNGTVEGGAFRPGSYDIALVSEGKQIYYAKPAAYGDSGTVTPPPPPPPPPAGDTTKPNLTINAPANGATVSGTITIEVTATDNIGVTKVDIFYDGSNVIRQGTSQGTYGWGSRFDTTKIADGSHVITVTAYDAKGNSETKQITLNVSNYVAPPAPSISSFSANPSSIVAGNTTTFSWSTQNTTNCSITPGGIQNSTGTSWRSGVMNSVGTFTYTLSCVNSAQSSTSATTTVTVTAPPVPPSNVTLSASPTSIKPGGSSRLTWSSTNANSCVLNPGSYSGTGSSSKLVSNINSDTVFKATCTNSAGSTSSPEVKVTVVPDPVVADPEIVSFAPKISPIAKGTSGVLKWVTSNVVQNGCSLTPSLLTNAPAEGEWTTPVLNASESYTLSCRNKDGKVVAASTSIFVEDTPAPPAPAPLDPGNQNNNQNYEQETITAPSGEQVENVAISDTVNSGQLVTLDPSTLLDAQKIENIERVEFYSGSDLIAVLYNPPFVLDTKVLGAGTYSIVQRTYYTDGSSSEQAQVITVEAAEDEEKNGEISKLKLAIGGGTTLMTGALVGLLTWHHNYLRIPLPFRKKRLASNILLPDHKEDVPFFAGMQAPPEAPGNIINPKDPPSITL